MPSILKEKIKAFFIHFALSLTIVSFVIALVIYFWYPLEYLGLTRFKTVALLIMSVDLVMGPVLTFVVFNSKKKSLRFDLAVIAVLQFSALAYGIHTLFIDHPVYITFNKDRFTIVQARDAKPEKAKLDEFKISKLSSAKIAYAKMPEDKEEENKLLFDVLNGKPDLDQRTEYYEPYEENIDSVLAKSLDPKLIFPKENAHPEAQTFLNKHDGKIEDFAFVPLSAPSKFAILVLDKKSAQPIDTIDLDPWELALNKIEESKTK